MEKGGGSFVSVPSPLPRPPSLFYPSCFLSRSPPLPPPRRTREPGAPSQLQGVRAAPAELAGGRCPSRGRYPGFLSLGLGDPRLWSKLGGWDTGPLPCTGCWLCSSPMEVGLGSPWTPPALAWAEFGHQHQSGIRIRAARPWNSEGWSSRRNQFPDLGSGGRGHHGGWGLGAKTPGLYPWVRGVRSSG